MKNLTLFLMLLVLLISCGDNHPKTTQEYEEFADKFCKCSEPSTIAFEETLHMIEKEKITDKNETVSLFTEVIINAADESGKCLVETLGKEGIDIALNDPKANEAIKRKCPKSPFMMMNGHIFGTVKDFLEEGGTEQDIINHYLQDTTKEK